MNKPLFYKVNPYRRAKKRREIGDRAGIGANERGVQAPRERSPFTYSILFFFGASTVTMGTERDSEVVDRPGPLGPGRDRIV